MARQTLPSYWTEVIAIIESGLKPHPQRVASFADHLAKRLEEAGESRLADRINKLVERSAMPAGSTFTAQRVQAETPATDLFGAMPVDARTPILLPEAQAELDRFVRLNQQAAALQRNDLSPPTALLLYGPSGCGKTMAANSVAAQLGRPLLTVRLDTLMTSYLGDSAKNLRRAFDAGCSVPSILFLDEFDAVAKMRDDPQELGEIKRLVNSLLQNLDAASGNQVVVAATNHEHLLDVAIWRRFDVAIELGMPSRDQIIGIITQNLDRHPVDMEVVSALSALGTGLSGADVTGAVTRALQDSALSTEPHLQSLLTTEFLRAREKRTGFISDMTNKKSLVIAISGLAELSNKQIAVLAGCTPVYVYKVLKQPLGGTDDD